MADELEKEELSEEKIASFLQKFIATVGIRQRYAGSSQLYNDNLNSLFSLTAEILEQFGDFTFSEFHNHLMYNNSPLSVSFQQQSLVGAYVYFMLEHNMKSVTFHQGCEKKDLNGLFNAIAEYPDRLRTGAKGIFDEIGIRGISIAPLGELEMAAKGLESAQKVSAYSDGEKNAPDIELPEFEQDEQHDEQPGEQPSMHADELPERQPVKEHEAIGNAGIELNEAYTEQDSADDSAYDGKTVIMNRDDMVLGDDDADGHTRIMTRPKEPETKTSTIRKEIMDKQVRPPNTVHLVVMTRLGRQVVDDAKVTVLSKPPITRNTAGQRGASFFLLPNLYKIRVNYDKYTMTYDIELGADLDEIQMDVNLLDATTS